jgi:hypothetical protein
MEEKKDIKIYIIKPETNADIDNLSENISILIYEISSESSLDSTFTDKTELNDLIKQYRDFFGNDKVNHKTRHKLIRLVKNLIKFSIKK